MASPTQARVIIVGGSVAGLTLANALEQLGISYILLEKYDKIAPDLGASIAVMANAGRILDQLGCYQKIQDMVQDGRSNRHMTCIGQDGVAFGTKLEAIPEIIKRFGYGFIFLQRRQLLDILYDNIRDKSPILTNKNVVSLEHVDGGVRAIAKDGTIYTGEILVGADGVHSQVRKEMWRLADSKIPNYIPSKDREGFPIPYRCIFGISKLPEGFDPMYSGHVMGTEYSFLVSGAPPDGDDTERMFWFLFLKNQEPDGTLHKDIPRYTNEDMGVLAEKHRDNLIWTNVPFGKVWDSRVTATLTALPEFVYSRWHFGRILTIGDAAHKFNPIGGQGGNQAIEDCAVLINQLTELLGTNPPGNNRRLSDKEVESAFIRIQNFRMKRAEETRDQSHQTQSLMAHEGLLNKALSLYMRYFSSSEDSIKILSKQWPAAARIYALPVPERSRTEFFDDERRKPRVGAGMGSLMLVSSIVVGVATLAQTGILKPTLLRWK